MKKCAKRKMLRKTLYIDSKLVDKIEQKAKKQRRKFSWMATDILEKACTND